MFGERPRGVGGRQADTLKELTINGSTRETQRRRRIQSFAFVLSACLSAIAGSFFGGAILWNAQQGARIELEGRINPNDAPAESLVRLRGIGMSRAAAIVAYRESFRRSREGRPAFQKPDDLQAVKGIGPKTVENVRQALKFE